MSKSEWAWLIGIQVVLNLFIVLLGGEYPDYFLAGMVGAILFVIGSDT